MQLQGSSLRQRRTIDEGIAERWHEARRCGPLQAYCQRPTGLADEMCWWATVPDVSAHGLRLVVERRFDSGTVLAVDLLDKERYQKHQTRLVRVKQATDRTDGRWSIDCTFLDTQPADESGDALLSLARIERDSVTLTAPGPLGGRHRPPLPPFPVRPVLVRSVGWSLFLLMLLYLTNAWRDPSQPCLWTFEVGLGIVALAVMMVLLSAAVDWLNKLVAARMGHVRPSLWARTLRDYLVPRRFR